MIELDFWNMAKHLKSVFYMFQHIGHIGPKQCFYWIPDPRLGVDTNIFILFIQHI